MIQKIAHQLAFAKLFGIDAWNAGVIEIAHTAEQDPAIITYS